MSEPWAYKPTVRDHVTAARFIALRVGFIVALLVTIVLEDGARAAGELIRRSLH